MRQNLSTSWPLLATFASAVDAALENWLGEHYRLGLSEYRALTLLSQTPAKELRIAELAQQVGLTSTSTTRLVSRLENKGYALRDVCDEDGRGVYAVINEAGEDLVHEARELFEAHLEEILSNPRRHLPDLDIAALVATLMEVKTLLKP